MICRQCGKVVPYETGGVPSSLSGLCKECIWSRCKAEEVATARTSQEKRRQEWEANIALIIEVQDRARAEREKGV